MALTSTLCMAAKVLAVEKYIARLLDGATPCEKREQNHKIKITTDVYAHCVQARYPLFPPKGS